jgi:DNA-binding winged helix-turn-helix (wHTH) protein
VAAETLSWLVGLAAQIGAERGWPAPRTEAAEALAARLAAGLPAEALPLGQALRGIAGRDRVLSLLAAGVRGEADLARLSPGEWRRLVPEAEGDEILRWREAPGPTPAGRRKRRAHAAPAPDGQAPPSAPSPEGQAARRSRGERRESSPVPPPAENVRPCALDRLAALTGHATAGEGERGGEPVLLLDTSQPHQAIFHGQAVYLRPVEWRLLVALAAEPGRCVPFSRLLETVWSPGEAVEAGQLNWHRHHLAKKLATALPPGASLPLRTVPRRGYCLDLEPREVEVRGSSRAAELPSFPASV